MPTSGLCFSVSPLCSEPRLSLRKILPVCHYMGNEISKCLSWQYNTSFRRAVSSQAGGANVKIQAPPGAVAVARIWRRWMQRAGLAPRAGGRCPSLRMGDAIKLFPFFPCAQMYLHREVSYFYCKKNRAYC